MLDLVDISWGLSAKQLRKYGDNMGVLLSDAHAGPVYDLKAGFEATRSRYCRGGVQRTSQLLPVHNAGERREWQLLPSSPSGHVGTRPTLHNLHIY